MGVEPRLAVHDLAVHREVQQHSLEGLPLDFSISSVAISSQGDRVATVAYKSGMPVAGRVAAGLVTPIHHVGMWDAQTGRLLWSSEPERNYPMKAAFSPDARYLATAGMQIRLAEPEKPEDLPYGWGRSGYYGKDGRIIWISWTPHFRASHNAILLWDAATGDLKRAILHPEYNITSVAFTTDGAGLLVTGGENPEFPRKTSAMVARLSLAGAFDDD